MDAELKQDLVLNVGATMRLHAIIKGRPTPRIIWAKMNTNLKDRQGIVIKSTNTESTVVVENVNRYDAGKYILSLESVVGMKMYTIIVKIFGEYRTVVKRKYINFSFFPLVVLEVGKERLLTKIRN